jgi:hypothetical protein
LEAYIPEGGSEARGYKELTFTKTYDSKVESLEITFSSHMHPKRSSFLFFFLEDVQ